MRRRRTTLEPNDYVALLLLCLIGLFWARLALLVSVPFDSFCVENIAGYGTIRQDPLTGFTLWDMLFGVSALATVYAASVLIAASRQDSGLVLFRLTVISGLLLSTLLLRAVSSGPVVTSDAFVPIDEASSPVTRLREYSENHAISYAVQTEDGGWTDDAPARTVCYFRRQRTLVMPDPKAWSDFPRWHALLLDPRRGALIRALQDAQHYHILSDADQARIETYLAMQAAEPHDRLLRHRALPLDWTARTDEDYRTVSQSLYGPDR